METPIRHLPGLLPAACLLALAAGPGCKPAEPVAAAPVREAPATPPKRVEIATVEEAPPDRTQPFTTHGSLLPRRASPIAAEVAGRVTAVHVELGDRLEAGAPLFRIDPRPYELALAEAQAGLELARAEARQLAAEQRRAESLRVRHVTSDQAVERLATSLAVARARERQAEIRRDLAARNLALTEVRAPFPSSVAERRVDEGTLVSPQTVVVVLHESAELEARVAIPEPLLGRVRPGDRAELFLEGSAGPLEARVRVVSDAIDPDTRTFLVRIPVRNSAHVLKAGAFLRAVIHAGAPSGALLVPRSAVRSADGESSVLVVRNGFAEAVEVSLGLVAQDTVEVLRGLEPGARVVVGADAARLVPGTPVAEATP